MAGLHATGADEERTLVTSSQPKGRELRLALGMRGGVSLAVWIGGACAEISALCDRPTKRRFWGPLLDAAGYGRVRIDVLAGASAGGLNGVLLAASLLYGVPFDNYRDIWLEVADLKALLRDPRQPGPISVLKGDEYFLEQMVQRLGNLVSSMPVRQQLGTDYLDLHLSATLLKPVAVPVLEDWGERYEEVTHRASFRFRHNRYTSDFRQAGDVAEENAGAVFKLALAARSTSSFPGAFEPATLGMKRPQCVGARAALADRDNLFGLFSDASRPAQKVIDGGVLDNIPLGKAIDGIAASSAGGPTERWLLYLHPSPDAGPPGGATVAAGDLDTIRTVLGASTARGTAESVLDDLDCLRTHNQLALRYRTMRRALLGMLVGRDAARFFATARDRSADYWRLRSEATAGRIRGLLEDPVRVLGEDPFTCEQERWPLTGAGGAWSVYARDTLQTHLRDRSRPSGDSPYPVAAADLATLGVAPLPRMTQVCLEALWRLEHLGADAAALAGMKQRLYAVLDGASLLAHMGDLFWPVYAAHRAPQPSASGQWATEALEAWEQFLADPDTELAGAPELRKAFAVLRAELGCRLEQLTGVVQPPLHEALWAELASCVVSLGELAASAPGKPEDEEAGLFAELLGYVADQVGAAGGEPLDRAAQVLAAVEVVTFPLQTLSARPPQEIRYLRVAGSRHSPLEGYFPGGRLTVGDKLAGNDLMNFAAFYKRSWRANDWMWGRLDAAATLVDLVVQPQAVRAHFATAQAPLDAVPAVRASAFTEFVRGCVCRPLDELPDGVEESDRQAWDRHFAALWDERAEEATAEATALFAGSDGAPLTCIRELLTSRRQWELLVQEVPGVVRAVVDESLFEGRRPPASNGRAQGLRERFRDPLQREPLLRALVADDAAANAPVRTPRQLQDFLRSYAVGRERVVGDVGRPRFTALVADLAVVVWNALTVGLGGARVLRPVGGLLRFMRLLALSTVSAPRWALVALPVLAVLGVVAAVAPPAGLGRVAGAVVALAATATLLYWSRPLRAVLLLAAVVAAGWASLALDATFRVSLGQWGPWVVGRDGVRIIAMLVVLGALLWALRAVGALRGRRGRR